MRNFRITFLIVGCLFAFGIYGLVHIPKQEFPEYTICLLYTSPSPRD